MSAPGRYADIRDSGLEWVEDFPASWQVTPLFRHARLCKRSNRGMVNDNLLSLSYGRVVRKDIETVEGLLPESFETYQVVEKDDVVFRLTDLQNDKRSLRSALCTERGIITSAYLAVQPVDMVPAYLGYLMRGYDLSKVFYSLGSGLRQSLKYSEMKRLPLLVPARDEQTQIAKFLDYETAKIDQLIDKQRQLIALLKEKRQAVISHAVTKGLNPKAPMKDSGAEWLGEVPAHWEVTKLFHLTSRVGDGLHGTPQYEDGTGLYFVNGNNLEDGTLSIGASAREVPATEFERHKVPLSEETVLLSINGTIGKVALYAGEPVILGKSAAYINCLHRLAPRFLRWFFETSNARRYYELVSTGTTISNLSLDSIRQLKVGVPPTAEQEAIVEYCEAQREKYRALIGTAVALADTLQERRTALISAAVTGKIDVRSWRPPKGEATQEVA